MVTDPPTPVPDQCTAILDAAAAVITEHGMGGLTVTAVMNHAKISRTAFYRRFDGIPEVVSGLLERLRVELVQAAGDWFRDEIGSPEIIHGNLLAVARTFHRHGAVLEAIVMAAGSDPRVRDDWDNLVEAFRVRTEAAIERDQAAGAISTAIQAHDTALALTWLDERAATRLLGRSRAGTPEEYADLLTPIWTRVLFGG